MEILIKPRTVAVTACVAFIAGFVSGVIATRKTRKESK